MNTPTKQMRTELARRDMLRLSGFAVGGVALGGVVGGSGANPAQGQCYPTTQDTQRYSYFETLEEFDPGTPLEANEMRISFMGSAIPMPRRAQGEMSIFVEVGWDATKQEARDQFVFDLGCGVCRNYQAMKVGYGRMDKVFITHLHGDHVNDLIHVYGFGNGGDRKSPLYVWGHGPSGVPNPGNNPILDPAQYRQNLGYSGSPEFYDDGTKAFCRNLREALRWHTESQAFQSSSYASYPMPEEIQKLWGLPVLPVPAGDDPPQDANALIPIELDWTLVGGVAYDNQGTGAKVTHFPVIHCRKGSMGYKLEWTAPEGQVLSMIYTSDTKPETNCIDQAINGGKGVDVFIHEMIVPAEVWAMKHMGLTEPGSGPQWEQYVQAMTAVQNSSHTPQGAFGYLLSQIVPRPRLTVATHFPVADDTVACALESVRNHVPDVVVDKDNGNLVWSFDLMVLRVFPDRIEQRRAVVNDFSFNPPARDLPSDAYAPKYHTATGTWDPFFQIDRTTEILSTEEGGQETYRRDGY